MGIPDPSWFYASLVQSSSAIIGLIGAVFASHIIEHLSNMREERRDLIGRVDALYRQLKARTEQWKKFKDFLQKKIKKSEPLSHEEITWEGIGAGDKPSSTIHPEDDLKALLE